MLISISYALSGLALLLFALRFLIDSLDREIGRYLGSGLIWVSKNSWNALGFGCLITLIVQASSVTILTTMGFLGRGVISLERALLIMLGAAVGSSLKGWFGSQFAVILGPATLLLGSLGVVLSRDQRRKRLFGVLIAIGMTFLGLQLLETALAPLAQTHFAHLLLDTSVDYGIPSILKTGFVGMILSFVLQSSSSVLMIVWTLASQQVISLPAALGVMLGANIGTTSTAIFASLSQENLEVKRLAFGYVFVKVFAAVLVLTYFRTHVLFLEEITQAFGLAEYVGLKIAMFHTWMNLMNALTWWLLLPILLKVVVSVIPGKDHQQKLSILTTRVQLLLGSLPGRAISEGIAQVQGVIRDLHWVCDSLYHLADERGEKQECSSVLEESLRRCEKSRDVLDSVRDVVWRYVQATDRSAESQGRVLWLISFITELKCIEEILHSSVSLFDSEGFALAPQQSAVRAQFQKMHEDLQPLWERLYSLETYTPDLPSGTSGELHVGQNEGLAGQCFQELESPHFFELTLRLDALKNLLERRLNHTQRTKEVGSTREPLTAQGLAVQHGLLDPTAPGLKRRTMGAEIS